MESAPAVHLKECTFKTLLHWVVPLGFWLSNLIKAFLNFLTFENLNCLLIIYCHLLSKLDPNCPPYTDPQPIKWRQNKGCSTLVSKLLENQSSLLPAYLKKINVMWCNPHNDGIDVTGVSGEGLLAGPFPQVPQLGQRVTGSRDEGVLVLGESQGHAVSNVVGEDELLLAGLQVPQTAGEDREEERHRWGKNWPHFGEMGRTSLGLFGFNS